LRRRTRRVRLRNEFGNYCLEKNAMKNLFVGNLPHSTTEDELRSLFSAHGNVEKVSVVTDRETGRSRGFAFVEMSDAGEADKAVAALNGTDLGGRALKVNEARPKTDRGFGGQGQGRSRGGSRDDYRGHARQPREPRW
jgi:cold-inducible RNA-binding protein